MRQAIRGAAPALLLLGALAWAPPAAADWTPDVDRAVEYAEDRQGSIRFAAIDEDGRLWRHRATGTVTSASVIKVMFLVAYLRLGSVDDRSLREDERDMLGRMIRRSNDAAATRVRNIVGGRRIERLAERADMDRFRFDPEIWGYSLINAREQARFMQKLERYVPERHEGYARRLLRTIVSSQRWGIPEAAPEGWTPFFKGGWGSATGARTHQVAFLEMGDRRIALAILTTGNPSHSYGTSSVRGVASRLMRDLRAESEGG